MAKAAKTTKAAKPVQPEPVSDNRYKRAAKCIIEMGTVESVDLTELAMKANMSVATAGHCHSAWIAITEACREAGLMPSKAAAPKKAPIAPVQGEMAAEREPAAA